MSSALAIASVSVVLVDVLNNGLIDSDVGATVGGSVKVTALPPDRIQQAGAETSQLNLFLYRVAPSAAWRNVDPRDVRRNGPTPLALDLRYLLTAYGERDFHAEILLGYAMQLLYETPVFTRAQIATALATPTPTDPGGALPVALSDLATSGLADQIEMIRVTLAPLPTEEISNVWTALQTPYRPTAAYDASVVLIDSPQPVRTPLPVRDVGVYAGPFQRPRIEQLQSASGEQDPIGFDSTLVIAGQGLLSPATSVRVGNEEVPPAAGDATDREIRIDLTLFDLKAGATGVQVVHAMLIGNPPVPHGAIESNVATFVLTPRISAITATTTANAAGSHDGEIAFDVAPGIKAGQRLAVSLNALPSGPAISFTAVVIHTDTTTVELPVTGVPAGTYLVRVQVDGAESELTVDAQGAYDGPTVVIP